MAAITKDSVKAEIALFVTSQGNQVGLEGLTKILEDILTLIPDAE